MSLKQHFELMGVYNQWMNAKVYEAASSLSAAELAEDKGAFFGSVLGTLNHIVVGDTIWLKRFAVHPGSAESLREVTALPMPSGLNHILFDNYQELYTHRKWLDEQIIQWTQQLPEEGFDTVLNYRNTQGIAGTKQFGSLIFHFFNHQTHHRGQVSTLLSQAGKDIGVTDLLKLIPG